MRPCFGDHMKLFYGPQFPYVRKFKTFVMTFFPKLHVRFFWNIETLLTLMSQIKIP